MIRNRYYCLITYDCNGQTLNDAYFSSKEKAKKWAASFKAELFSGDSYTATLYNKSVDGLVRDESGNAISCETWHFKPSNKGQKLTVHVR